jgi:hypothetical protein
VVGNCDCANEPLFSIKCMEFLDKMKTSQLLKKNSAPRSISKVQRKSRIKSNSVYERNRIRSILVSSHRSLKSRNSQHAYAKYRVVQYQSQRSRLYFNGSCLLAELTVLPLECSCKRSGRPAELLSKINKMGTVV